WYLRRIQACSATAWSSHPLTVLSPGKGWSPETPGRSTECRAPRICPSRSAWYRGPATRCSPLQAGTRTSPPSHRSRSTARHIGAFCRTCYSSEHSECRQTHLATQVLVSTCNTQRSPHEIHPIGPRPGLIWPYVRDLSVQRVARSRPHLRYCLRPPRPLPTGTRRNRHPQSPVHHPPVRFRGESLLHRVCCTRSDHAVPRSPATPARRHLYRFSEPLLAPPLHRRLPGK